MPARCVDNNMCRQLLQVAKVLVDLDAYTWSRPKHAHHKTTEARQLFDDFVVRAWAWSVRMYPRFQDAVV